jgi:hypothetical protein
LNEPLPFDQYNLVKYIGTDEINGRFGEVNIWQCKICGRYWLHYLVEYEAFTKSGRYFMGLITQEIANSMHPNSVVDYLNKLDWHLYGGSYFGRKGRAAGNVSVDL